jgi:hypothetical protein
MAGFAAFWSVLRIHEPTTPVRSKVIGAADANEGIASASANACTRTDAQRLTCAPPYE